MLRQGTKIKKPIFPKKELTSPYFDVKYQDFLKENIKQKMKNNNTIIISGIGVDLLQVVGFLVVEVDPRD